MSKTKQKSLLSFRRIDAIAKFLIINNKYLNKKRSGELVEIIKKNIFEKNNLFLSIRQIQRYIKEAKKIINEYIQKDIDKNYQTAIVERLALIERAKAKDNLKLEYMLWKDLAELQGLYLNKINVGGLVTLKNIDLSKFTDYGLERLKKGDRIEEILLDVKSINTE